MQTNPILVESSRGNIVESFHRGAICVVNQKKEIIYSIGNPHQLCYPRSAMKFFQQIPLISMGGIEKFGLNLEEVAILCGSHNGESKHVEVVRSILKKGNLTEDDLECGPQEPTLKKDKIQLYQNNLKPSKIHNNCSGKHAGFLLLCRLLQLETKNYISPSHPIQKTIAETCAKFYETPISEMICGIDGCSAPIYGFTLYHQALAYMNLCNPQNFSQKEQYACETVLRSVAQYPFMIAGTHRYCTELMEVSGHKIIGKTGADGVYCFSIPDKKLGIALKIDDGKMGPQYNVAQSLLEQSGLLSVEESKHLHKFALQENKNFGGLNVGEIRVNKQVNLNIFE
jgi:L-asparaginase II